MLLSAEASRLRSVSTPVAPQLGSTVSYNAVADSVNLPDVSLAHQNSVMASEVKKKRSMSDLSKGGWAWLACLEAKLLPMLLLLFRSGCTNERAEKERKKVGSRFSAPRVKRLGELVRRVW